MSAASFLHSSFLQAISSVMLWLVHVQKVPQASEHLCPAKLQTRCDVCCACQSICPFIPTDSGMARAVDPQNVLQPKTVHGCVPARAPIPHSTYSPRLCAWLCASQGTHPTLHLQPKTAWLCASQGTHPTLHLQPKTVHGCVPARAPIPHSTYSPRLHGCVPARAPIPHSTYSPRLSQCTHAPISLTVQTFMYKS